MPDKVDSNFSHQTLHPAVAYCRVSTTRQAEHELSLKEQEMAIASYAAQNSYEIVETYLDAGASGTTDKRAELQRLVHDATKRPSKFVAVLVFNQSRFFRNSEEFSAYRRRLDRQGVKLISVTQDWGDDHAGTLVANIVAAIDEHSSAINAEQVKLMMCSNARQGWWNGSRAPFGYTVGVDSQLGKKMKKKLVVDDYEAEIVRRIFRMYVTGEEGSGALGLKAITTKLNRESIRLRGKPFITSTVSDMLRRTAYVGEYTYNMKDSRNGKTRPPSEWIRVPCPPIVERELFEAAQATLVLHSPKKTSGRRVNSPTLLSQIGRCGEPGCNAGLLLMTGKSGQYRYLTCQTRRTVDTKACTLRNHPISDVDELVIATLEQKLLTPDRLTTLLAGLLTKSDTALAERKDRLSKLRTRRTEAEGARSRIWDAIEVGLSDPRNEEVRGRLEARESQIRVLADEIRTIEAQDHDRPTQRITPEVLEKFSKLMRESLRAPESHLMKSYLHMLVSEVRLSNQSLVIRGRTSNLEMVVARAAETDGRLVPTFAKNWCTRNDSNVRPSDS